MPYFVYRIHPPKRLERVDAFERYRDARERVRAMRKSASSGEPLVRMIFAADEAQAEQLLRETREPRPAGEE